ncbi:MAG: hypothetical protein WEE89_00795 [Gemmatimonadota bacterium]
MRLIAVLLGAAALLASCGDAKEETAPAAPADLQALVDSVMPRLQALAGLAQKGPVKVKVQPRDSLRRYIEARLQEELPAAELEGIRVTYVTLGLMPEDLDLRALLLDLYTEQVVGYYDPSAKTLFVVQDAQRDAVRPVLVHELVHALQDQHTNLDSLISRDRGNDRQSAAQAAIEGHATMVMFAFLAEGQAGGPVDPRTLPDIGAQIRPGLEQQNQQFPVFQKAPRILRETMLFPYADGAAFVHKLWLRPLQSGFGDPYPAPLGERLPQSTEQVLHPESRFLVARDEPTEIRLEAGDAAMRENNLGELEMSHWLVEHLGADSDRFANGWDGDRYRLIQVGGAPALIWYSVWDSDGAADAFAEAARRIGEKRGRSVMVERIALSGRPGVRIVDAATAAQLQQIRAPGAAIQP